VLIAELNRTGQTANNILTLFKNNKSKNKGRREHTAGNASMENRLSLDVLKKRYKASKSFTSCVVFGVGDRYLVPEVRDETIHHNEAPQNKEKVNVNKRKSDLCNLVDEVSKICHQHTLDGNFS
jgi:hypothetical protein